ncbi:MAG: hypothetical protein FWF00_00135 [Endomicrobia bacterium]|nr:hypothetical protein [Endomicrobiia bacterium]MCL2506086.1 hypothetical protein [Endomicrobiia bacterium]
MALYKYPQKQDEAVYNENQRKIQECADAYKDDVKLTVKSNKTIHSIKDFCKDFIRLAKIYRKDKEIIYVAFVPDGGLGDILRQKTVIAALVKMYPDIVVDIYHKSTYPFIKGIKNIRYFLNKHNLNLMKSQYDMTVEYLGPNCEISHISIINSSKPGIIKILENLEKYKKQYPYCFDGRKYFYLQQEAVKNQQCVINVMKITTGVSDIEDLSLSIDYEKKPLKKFAIFDNDKYITIQTGVANKGNTAHPKLWSVEKWESLLSAIKNEFGSKLKIVQVGVGVSGLKNAYVNVVDKTSIDELCSILKKSMLHIDTDCGCVHIAKALGVKSLVLFGQTNAEYIAYPENINIVSSVCSNCYVAKGFVNIKCLLGNDKPLCMESIAPEFVAQKAIEYLKDSKLI